MQDSRSYAGSETDTDHKLVLCKIKLDKKCTENQKLYTKINIASFVDKEMQKEFHQAVNDECCHLENNLKPQEKWRKLTKILPEKRKESTCCKIKMSTL